MSLQSNRVLPPQAARPLRHWSEAARERARSHVERIWSDWCARWQLANDGVSVLNACDSEAAHATTWHRVAAHPLWLSTATPEVASPGDALQAMLFGQGRVRAPMGSTPIAQDVAAESMADLVRGLSQLVNGNDRRGPSVGDSPPVADGRRWSGALAVHLAAGTQAGAIAWILQMGDSVAGNLCGPAPGEPVRSGAPLAQVTDALEGRRLSFSVLLHDTTLTLGNLQMLRIGDVIPLAHRLDQPLRIVAPHSADDALPLCAAYLGSRADFRAVELVPATAEPQPSNS